MLKHFGFYYCGMWKTGFGFEKGMCLDKGMKRRRTQDAVFWYHEKVVKILQIV